MDLNANKKTGIVGVVVLVVVVSVATDTFVTEGVHPTPHGPEPITTVPQTVQRIVAQTSAVPSEGVVLYKG